MTYEEKDMRSRIARLEDNMLRCKNFQEQLRMRDVLTRYRRQLQVIIWKEQGE